ncbi:hypothetical protein A2442_02435 [Candidatus Campbellbacteria bacterium RIFOXYC2_FULL_35_25]|uniref:Uncharacterized protein n=1 Tax=Candidatus Campbellbacteria bacterium RIFOXYC2_FULL_35_25 TaxID=1797582 RepID=A0A1F5EJR1_9BACT|nr:MAG: hypothetical protein A2442_02435 [Candidatus Campbellbacteria bacterium RIFOXYC2_FULL_35_25]
MYSIIVQNIKAILGGSVEGDVSLFFYLLAIFGVLIALCIEKERNLIKFFTGFFFIGLITKIFSYFVMSHRVHFLEPVIACLFLLFYSFSLWFGVYYGNKYHMYYYYDGRQMERSCFPAGGVFGLFFNLFILFFSAATTPIHYGIIIYVIMTGLLFVGILFLRRMGLSLLFGCNADAEEKTN